MVIDKNAKLNITEEKKKTLNCGDILTRTINNINDNKRSESRTSKRNTILLYLC